MTKLEKMNADGTISIDELASIPELIERAKLVQDGLSACQKTISFHLGQEEVEVYSYTGIGGEYESWGIVHRDGTFVCYCNWGGDHESGRVNLMNSSEVFLALGAGDSFSDDLKRFLREQIRKAQN